MKSITPKDSRYIPFVQQQDCCVVACILMIMYKRGIPLLEQELLGYYLGLVVNPEREHLFWNARTGKKPKAGFGTQIFSKQYDPNKVFKKLRIPLKFSTRHIDSFNTKEAFTKFLASSVKKDKDLAVCFNHGILNDEESRSGHVCIIDRIYLNKDLVRLIDPSPNRPKWRLVKVGKLMKAMKLHPAHGGSLWEFTAKS